MKTHFLSILLIFFAGVMIPLAVAFNSRIGQGLKSPLLGAAAIPAVGVIFILLVMSWFRPTLPNWENFNEIPWYAWMGGAMVTLYFVIMIFNAPKVGLGFAISLIVAGQLTMSTIIDHFGLFGIPVTSFSWGRFVGAILIVTGVALLKFF